MKTIFTASAFAASVCAVVAADVNPPSVKRQAMTTNNATFTAPTHGDSVVLNVDGSGVITLSNTVITGSAGGGATNALTKLGNMTNANQWIAVSTNAAFSVTTNGVGVNGTNTVNIPLAGASAVGLLHSTDWTAFNAKQPGHNVLSNATVGHMGITNVVSTVQALTNAMKVVSNRFRIAEGFYDLGATKVFMSNGVVMVGAGPKLTVINSQVAQSSINGIALTNNNWIYNCTLQLTNTDRNAGVIGSAATSTNIYFENVEFIGETDCVFPWNSYGVWRDCQFYSGWDAVIFQSGVLTQYNCGYNLTARTVGNNNGQQTVALRVSGGTNVMFGGAIECRGGYRQNIGIDMPSAGARTELYGTSITITATNGANASITNHPGSVLILAQVTPNVGYVGSRTNSNLILSTVDGVGRELWTVVIGSGIYTNTENDRYTMFDTSTVAQTNRLPDIGFKSVVTTVVSNAPANNDTYIFNGVTYTWKDSPSGLYDIPRSGDQVVDALLLQGILDGSIDGAITTALVNDTNVVITSRPNQLLTVSQTGTWGVHTVTSNDFAHLEGRLITVADKTGAAATRNITILPQRNARINGATSYTITNNYGAATLQAIGTNWVVIQSGNMERLGLQSGSATLSNLLTVTASKLIGRGDSGAGAAQEITLGTGLSMSGTTLSAPSSGGGNVIGATSSEALSLAPYANTSGTVLTNSTITTDAGRSNIVVPGSITGSNGMTLYGSASGYTRWTGPNATNGFYEIIAPASIGQSNSVIPHFAGVAAGDVLGLVFSRTAQAGTNSIVTTNVTTTGTGSIARSNAPTLFNVTINGGLTLDGALTSGDGADFDGASRIRSTLNVDGLLSADSLRVTNAARFDSATTHSGLGSFDSLKVTNVATLTGAANMGSTATIAGLVSADSGRFTNAVRFDSTTTHTGLASFGSQRTTNAAQFDSTTTHTGLASFDSQRTTNASRFDGAITAATTASIADVIVTNNVKYLHAALTPTSQDTNYTADFTFATRSKSMTNAFHLSAVSNLPTDGIKTWTCVLRNFTGTNLVASLGTTIPRNGTNWVTVANAKSAIVTLMSDGSNGANITNLVGSITLFDSP